MTGQWDDHMWSIPSKTVTPAVKKASCGMDIWYTLYVNVIDGIGLFKLKSLPI